MINIFRKYFHNKKVKKNFKIDDVKRIFILTGAGISAESGIQTFRDKDGTWHKHSIYEVARPEAIELTPDVFFNFYNERSRESLDKLPNNAHKALATLDHFYEVYIVTQNVDNLHEKAGSKIIKHMHGELYKGFCTHCKIEVSYTPNIYGRDCNECHMGKIRPDVVLFKETPKKINDIIRLIEMSDVFIQIGTSGNVYPAANFAKTFKEINPKGLSINISKDIPKNNAYFKYSFLGKATKWVPFIVKEIINSKN